MSSLLVFHVRDFDKFVKVFYSTALYVCMVRIYRCETPLKHISKDIDKKINQQIQINIVKTLKIIKRNYIFFT